MKPLATLSITQRTVGATFVVVVVIALAAFGTTFKAGAQNTRSDQRSDRATERLIQKTTNSAIPNEPEAIVLVKTKKGVVEPGKTFNDVDNDWFKGFTLRAQNTSQRTITYIDVTFSFERPKDDAKQ